MRLHYLMCAAIILVQSACTRTEAADASGATVDIPTRVACADLGLLEQRAIGDDLRGRESPTDQARVVLGGRANFFASLAVIARLECVSPSDAEVDRALSAALDVARAAEATRSFYEQAAKWSVANLAATHVIAIRVQSLTPVGAD